jgi:hypothetical protein
MRDFEFECAVSELSVHWTVYGMSVGMYPTREGKHSFVGADVMGQTRNGTNPGAGIPFFVSCGRVQGLEKAAFCVNRGERWRGR